jgi:hypothetical protein
MNIRANNRQATLQQHVKKAEHSHTHYTQNTAAAKATAKVLRGHAAAYRPAWVSQTSISAVLQNSGQLLPRISARQQDQQNA